MKATLWLWSLVSTMLCISQSVYSSPLTDYRYLNSRDLQDSYLTPKRTGPSLSIVNPLDVLRQRLLLEIARRQMKENTKQVELNRQILKNVGKRDDGLYDLDYYDIDHNLLTSLNHPLNENSAYPKFQQQPPTNNMNPYTIHRNHDPSSAATAIASGLVADHAKFLNENLLNTNNNLLNNNNNINNNNDNTNNNLMDDNNNNLDNNNNNNNNNVNNNINDNDDDYQIKYIYSLHKNKPNNNVNSNKNNNYSH